MLNSAPTLLRECLYDQNAWRVFNAHVYGFDAINSDLTVWNFLCLKVGGGTPRYTVRMPDGWPRDLWISEQEGAGYVVMYPFQWLHGNNTVNELYAPSLGDPPYRLIKIRLSDGQILWNHAVDYAAEGQPLCSPFLGFVEAKPYIYQFTALSCGAGRHSLFLARYSAAFGNFVGRQEIVYAGDIPEGAIVSMNGVGLNFNRAPATRVAGAHGSGQPHTATFFGYSWTCSGVLIPYVAAASQIVAWDPIAQQSLWTKSGYQSGANTARNYTPLCTAGDLLVAHFTQTEKTSYSDIKVIDPQQGWQSGYATRWQAMWDWRNSSYPTFEQIVYWQLHPGTQPLDWWTDAQLEAQLNTTISGGGTPPIQDADDVTEVTRLARGWTTILVDDRPLPAPTTGGTTMTEHYEPETAETLEDLEAVMDLVYKEAYLVIPWTPRDSQHPERLNLRDILGLEMNEHIWRGVVGYVPHYASPTLNTPDFRQVDITMEGQTPEQLIQLYNPGNAVSLHYWVKAWVQQDLSYSLSTAAIRVQECRPATDGSKVVFLPNIYCDQAHTKLMCLDVESLQELWSVDDLQPGLFSTPVILGGYLYLHVHPDPDGLLLEQRGTDYIPPTTSYMYRIDMKDGSKTRLEQTVLPIPHLDWSDEVMGVNGMLVYLEAGNGMVNGDVPRPKLYVQRQGAT